MFHSFYFYEEFSKKQEKLENDKKEMNDLIVEGITSIYTAMRG
jgi:hypothetical protein